MQEICVRAFLCPDMIFRGSTAIYSGKTATST
ncbi:hypothetical protein RUM_05530 [Ruminococcus champanellensis 18P13 = JCM 17042]|uniref:Uncharacterized protein n=1 Tax=Ruminococcus champanellensis (strain DSM 18848 / JCM 17042 / KCTC 15320 / 18P13) TaxID=213810 RepID=D4LAX8_RUMC1|nr:hypothetical protein RUM_05530 [Ruminococcus champanellensis 18P13 = JCM 17042]